MKKRNVYIALIIFVAIWVTASVVAVSGKRKGIILGTVTDALSGDPVYKARISIGGRSTMRYIDKNFRITNLAPGTYQLSVTAPGFQSATRELAVHRGINRLDIQMKGAEIPGLDHIIVFAEAIRDRGLELEIRFVDHEGRGIEHYPRLEMTMDARLYVQLGTGDHSVRGELLYSGPVDLYWDSESSLGKNKGIITEEKLKLDRKSSRTYAVLDVVLHTPWGDLNNTVANLKIGE